MISPAMKFIFYDFLNTLEKSFEILAVIMPVVSWPGLVTLTLNSHSKKALSSK